MDIDESFTMWCLGDFLITIGEEVETGEYYFMPRLTALQGGELTLDLAEERLIKNYIRTRNFYWGYTPGL